MTLSSVLLVLVVSVGVGRAAPGGGKPADQHAESAEIASQIVQQLQTLGNHKYPPHAARSTGPVALQALPSSLHYETAASYYDPYSQDYYKLQTEPEPTSDPNITPSGLNVNGALGFISYLVLLVLLQSAVEGVAARAPNHRRKRSSPTATEDLVGRALDLLDLGLTSSDSSTTSSYPGVTQLLEKLTLLPAPLLASLQNQSRPSKEVEQVQAGVPTPPIMAASMMNVHRQTPVTRRPTRGHVQRLS